VTDQTPRVLGTVMTWNDDRGFGFITSEHGERGIFAHISAFPARRRPQVGDAVEFSPAVDDRGRSGANRLVYRAGAERLEHSTRNNGRRRRSPRFESGRRVGAAVALIILGVVTTVVIGEGIAGEWIAGLYGIASVASFSAYAIDKSLAGTGRRRVPESRLLLLDVLGGWPGGFLAQQALRHKTVKVSFQRAFWSAVVLNIALLGAAPILLPVVQAFLRSSLAELPLP
jgi:uncharacterized membrane protein YsdA (DUF1294 family)/cold shock CspA family protein